MTTRVSQSGFYRAGWPRPDYTLSGRLFALHQEKHGENQQRRRRRARKERRNVERGLYGQRRCRAHVATERARAVIPTSEFLLQCVAPIRLRPTREKRRLLSDECRHALHERFPRLPLGRRFGGREFARIPA